MSAWAKPGVKCVCVDDSPTDRYGIEKVISKGSVYEISWAGFHSGMLCVRLVGVERDLSVSFGPVDYPFRATRFRPLITRTQSQDIALFTPILDGLRISEDAL